MSTFLISMVTLIVMTGSLNMMEMLKVLIITVAAVLVKDWVERTIN